jgi:putative membrane protein
MLWRSVAAAGIPSFGRIVTSWQVAPSVLGSCAVAAALYALGVARLARPWPVRRSFAFATGLLAVLLALDSGVDVYADSLVSIHMVQHLVLTIVAAPLLAAGAPMRLALGAAGRRTRRRLVCVIASGPGRLLSHPVSSWLLFVGLIVGWHLSPLYDLSVRHELLHDLEHLALLTTAVLFWAQVLRADPFSRPLGAVGRLLYLLAAMPAMSVIGVWLVIAHTARYPAYVSSAHALGVLPLYDQYLAGVIMWVGDALIGVVSLVIVGGALLREDQRAAARDAYGSASAASVEVGGWLR